MSLGVVSGCLEAGLVCPPLLGESGCARTKSAKIGVRLIFNMLF